MKITIEGFSQIELVKNGLDLTDALILRWFIDFKDTGNMYSEIVDKEKFYWIKYDSVIEDLPIINIKKDTLRRRFFKLAELGILKQFTKKEGGTYSMYAVGENFKALIDIQLEQYGKKVAGGAEKISDPCGKKVGTKNSSSNNSSTKKTQKQITDFGLSKKEKAILFTATIEKVILTKYFIKELASKYTLEKVQEFIIETAKVKKTQEIESDGAYIRGIIKKQGLAKPKNKPAAPIEKVEEKIIEEPKVKTSRTDFIKEYLQGRELSQLTTLEKQILNKTLGRMDYEQIS